MISSAVINATTSALKLAALTSNSTTSTSNAVFQEAQLERQCRIATGPVAWSAQLVLLTVVLSALLLKR